MDAHFACGSERGRYELTSTSRRNGETVGRESACPAAYRVADEVNLGAEDFHSLGVGIDVDQIPAGCAKLEVASINVNSGSRIVACYDAGEIIAPTCLRRKLDLLACIGVDDFPIFVALTVDGDELGPIGRSCAPIIMTAGHIQFGNQSLHGIAEVDCVESNHILAGLLQKHRLRVVPHDKVFCSRATIGRTAERLIDILIIDSFLPEDAPVTIVGGNGNRSFVDAIALVVHLYSLVILPIVEVAKQVIVGLARRCGCWRVINLDVVGLYDKRLPHFILSGSIHTHSECTLNGSLAIKGYLSNRVEGGLGHVDILFLGEEGNFVSAVDDELFKNYVGQSLIAGAEIYRHVERIAGLVLDDILICAVAQLSCDGSNGTLLRVGLRLSPVFEIFVASREDSGRQEQTYH